MANCHEYSNQGEGENAREPKNVERRRWCLRCGEIMYPAVVVMLSETFFVRAEQVFLSFQINVVARPDKQIAGRSIAAMYISA